MEATIRIEPDGNVYAVYSDDIAQAFQGSPMTVKRASQVEFNETGQRWEVRFESEPDRVAYSHASRAECIRWEVEQLNTELAGL